MELFLPDQIPLNGPSLGLIEDVEETARRVNEDRPLTSDVVDRILNDLLGDRVFSSNAIEGNTLTLGETLHVLQTGHIDVGRKREATEACNLGQAITEIAKLVAGEESCYSPDVFLSIHRVLLHDINDDWAGRYRGPGVMIQGAKYQPPDEKLVPMFIERVMPQLRRIEPTKVLLGATWAHWAIARIHPFHDGNGRMARLWQDLVLFRGRLTCAIIRPQDRREYLDALATADEGDFNPLVQLVAQRVAATFDKYLAELMKDREYDEWARSLVGEADARVQEERRIAYMRWSRKMQQLRSEFELGAAKINQASREMRVQVRNYELIDQQRWENIRAGVPTQQTWFFAIEVGRFDRRIRYIFFFGKHYWSELDNEQERSEHRACLLISEQQQSGVDAPRLDELRESPIGLREVFVVDNTFVRKRGDVGINEDVYDRKIRAAQIAKDFIQDVVLKCLG